MVFSKFWLQALAFRGAALLSMHNARTFRATNNTTKAFNPIFTLLTFRSLAIIRTPAPLAK